MRIQRLKDGVLWIAASNDEKVNQIIISAGTWKAVYDLTAVDGWDEEEMLEGKKMKIIKIDKDGVLTIALSEEEMEQLRQNAWEAHEIYSKAKRVKAPVKLYETSEKG